LHLLPQRPSLHRISAAGTKAKYDWAEARVVPADGQEVPVLKANVHVGKAIVNGIGVVLNPDAAAKAAPAAAKAAPAAAKAVPAATSTEKGSKTGSRKLLGWDWGFVGGPTAALDDASSNIQNAVMGNESVASAANKNLLGESCCCRSLGWNWVPGPLSAYCERQPRS